MTQSAKRYAGGAPVWAAAWAPWLGLAVVLAVAFIFRFYRLADMPPGLHYDEAFDGFDAHALLTTPLTQWPIFFTGNFGREPLFMYLLALGERLLGPSALALRVVAAGIGFMLTPALAWLGWEMAPSLRSARPRLALWSGLAVVALLWSQVFARYAIRVELYALVETLSFACLWRAWRTNRLGWWIAAGALTGLCLYTYLPARLLPLAFVPVAILALWRYRPALARRLRGLAAAGLAALAVCAPLGLYFVRNPQWFSTRLEQVSVLNRGAAVLLQNAQLVLGMVLLAGDTNPRNNLVGRPAFDALMGLFFVVGLLYALWRWRRPACLFLLSWLVAMLLPTLLSEYAPSFQRGIGALPACALLAALGLERLVAWGTAHRPAAQPWLEAAGWLVLAASLALTWRAFAAWNSDPALFYARDVGFEQLAQSVTADPPPGPVYISPRGYDHPTLRYLLLQNANPPELRGFNGLSCMRIPGGGPARYLFLTKEDPRGPGIKQYLPDSTSRTLVLDATGQTWATELRQPANGRVALPEMKTLPTRLDDGIELLGYWLSGPIQPGQRLYIRLFWRAWERPGHDYTTFVHLLQAQPDGSLQRVAGVDAEPGQGSCRTSDWRRGEIIIDELQLVPAPDTPAGAYQLGIGFYALESGQRLNMPGHTGNQLLLPPMTVKPH